jgi:hypothetical protein
MREAFIAQLPGPDKGVDDFAVAAVMWMPWWLLLEALMRFRKNL